jgi:2-polyprenyl-6-methoxyphenol hydroxylase-like FAD-dependent oxidoreductase
VSPGDHDVVIVGARCAGSPLAIQLARAGLSVCLVDRASFPSDTPSTHGVQPNGVEALERLGVLDRLREDSALIDRGLLAFDGLRVEIPSLTEAAGAPMLNARRTVLDEALFEAAKEAGAQTRPGIAVTGLLESCGRVAGVETTGGPIHARLVVGADGARSTVARLAGARTYSETPGRRIFLWAYFEGVGGPTDVWLGQQGDRAYLASATDGGHYLAAVVEPVERHAQARSERDRVYDDGIAAWPELRERVAGATRVGPVRVMSRWTGFFRQATGPGWALVGDAGHFKDPTPGQGIADALRQAEAMASAVTRGWGEDASLDAALREWWKWRDEDAWEMYWLAQDMGPTDAAPILGRELQLRLAGDPELTRRFVRVLNHEVPASKLIDPKLAASMTWSALAHRRGQRRAVLRELRTLAVNEFRRRPPRRAPALR